MTDASLQDRATELTDKLASLRHRRAMATLAGERFDSGPIAAAEAELVALADAEGVVTLRDRQTFADAQSKARAAVLLQLDEEKNNWLAVVARYEKASLAMSTERANMLASVGRQIELWKLLGDRIPDHLQARQQERRLDEWHAQSGVWAMQPTSHPAGTTLTDSERHYAEKAIAVVITPKRIRT